MSRNVPLPRANPERCSTGEGAVTATNHNPVLSDAPISPEVARRRASGHDGDPGRAIVSLPVATTVHCQPCAGATVGFVFICPGRFEASRGYPCAAGTGANLARALVELNRRAPAVFASAQRHDYLITNAWATVEYPALTGRSVPSEAEVLGGANLARLAAEIAELDTVIACGAQAHAALRELAARRPDLRIAFARHLSQRSVNMIPGGKDTSQRIARWVDQVLEQCVGEGATRRTA